MKILGKQNSQSGQILLITVMLLATVLTVVMAVTFKGTTETQISKLEEESQKSLAAAEAGIEALVQQGSGTVAINTLSGFSSSGFTGSATIDSTPSNQFASPLVRRDQEYTLYLSTYDQTTNIFSSPYAGTVALYYGSDTTACSSVALEISIISTDSPPKVTRYVADTSDILTSSTNDIGQAAGGTVGSVTFNCKTSNITLPVGGAKVILARLISLNGASSRIGLVGNGGNVPPQGKTLISNAQSSTGVSKEIRLFQSYPQIPTDFFVTSF